MAQSIITKLNQNNNMIKATCWNGYKSTFNDYSKSTSQAHRAAAQAMVDVLNENPLVSWVIHSYAEVPDGNGYVFIIENNVSLTEGKTEYRVTWSIDARANSYNSAARAVAAAYFRQDIGDGMSDTACVFEVTAPGDTNPVVVDLAEGN